MPHEEGSGRQKNMSPPTGRGPLGQAGIRFNHDANRPGRLWATDLAIYCGIVTIGYLIGVLLTCH